MIQYKCPACGMKLENDDDMGEQEDRCPSCGGVHAVPLSKAQKQAVSRAKKAKAARTRQRREEAREDAEAQAKKEAEPVAKKPAPWWDDVGERYNGPHCSRGLPILLMLLPGVCLVVFLVIVMIIGQYAESPDSGSGDAVKNREFDAHVTAMGFVKRHLKAPSTADFGYQTESECVTSLGDGRYRVSGWVDAENSFGAKIRNNYSCTIRDLGGGKWALETISIGPR